MATKTEPREVGEFTEVVLSSWGNAQIQQGETNSLIVEADADLMPYLHTEIVGSRLILGLRPNGMFGFFDWLFNLMWFADKNVLYRITMKKVDGLVISGSGNISAPQIRTDHLELKVSGSGRIRIDSIEAESDLVKISGSGDVRLGGGTVKYKEVRISGSGDVKAPEVRSQHAEVHVSGAGDLTLNVAETLDVSISGAGTVRVIGRPKISQHISGSGRIKYVDTASERESKKAGKHKPAAAV